MGTGNGTGARAPLAGVPWLSQADLKVGLEKAYSGRRQHHLFAFFGTGAAEVLKVLGPQRGDGDEVSVEVVPVRSELELREKMPPLGDDGAKKAFLVPWTHDIPLDLSGRFVLNGRVLRVGSESRLQALFGVNEVDDEARRSALTALLLADAGGAGAGGAQQGPRYSVAGGRLTLDTMWSAWLSGAWGLDTEGGLALDTLMAFAAVDGRGAAFVEQLGPTGGFAADGVKVRDELERWLRRKLGPAGWFVWRAWEAGRGRRMLELALLCEALVGSGAPAVRMWVKTKTREVMGIDDEAEVMVVAEALGREVAATLRVLDEGTRAGRMKLPAAEYRALARAADALVVDAEVRLALVESKRLPSAWTRRLDVLGEALARGAKVAGEAGAEGSEAAVAAVEAAVAALRGLESHVFFKDGDRELLTRAEMGVRLLAWLVARTDQWVFAGLTPHGEAEALGRWYAMDGGYVDRARHAARGQESDVFGRGVQAVVAAADRVRDGLDRRFTVGLKAWVESGQPSSQVVPIHEAVKRVAGAFLKGGEGRRLLVVLMDGMAWAQATELLESLGSRTAPWGPLAWHGQKTTRLGDGPLPVVFAALPTVTEVSRSAFFAGKVMGPGAKLGTEKDPERWAAHPEMKQAVGDEVPRLLLRAEGHSKAGGASVEALAMIGDRERRVVGVVVNAIDDSLKASHAVRHARGWGVESIASLGELLEKARESGRAVLFASDHGHVPSDRFVRVPPFGGMGGGERWRPWPAPGMPGHELEEYEVGLTGTLVYRPAGAHGVVLVTDEARVYAGNTHAGAHGGATLAEVVTPCLLIGCEDTAQDDAAMRPVPVPVPRWWHFDVSRPVMTEETVVVPAKGKAAKAQLELLAPVVDEVPAETRVVVKQVEVKKGRSAAAQAFAASEVLKARGVKDSKKVEAVVGAVEVLLERDGVMSAEAFAAAVGILPFRVSGYVSTLQEVLNLDGYEVLRFASGTRQVYLDRDKLGQLFEVVL